MNEEKIELKVVQEGTIESAHVSINQHGVVKMLVNLSKRWQGSTREYLMVDGKKVIRYIIDDGAGNLSKIDLSGLDFSERKFQAFETMEKDQFIVNFIPTSFFLGGEIKASWRK